MCMGSFPLNQDPILPMNRARHHEATFMNRLRTLALTISTAILCTIAAAAQLTQPTTDVLGAHLNYGRGCSACHSPHSRPSGNGKARALDTSTARGPILWGEDVSSLYGKTITTGGGKFVEVLPSSMSADTPDVTGMLTCLSCDDGNFAPAAMMKNSVYETLPSTYGNQSSVPTLIGSSATSAGSPQRASYGTYRRHQLRRLRLGLCQHQWRRLHAGCKIQPLRFELRLLRKTRRLPIISRWSFAPPATSPT